MLGQEGDEADEYEGRVFGGLLVLRHYFEDATEQVVHMSQPCRAHLSPLLLLLVVEEVVFVCCGLCLLCCMKTAAS